MKNKKIKWPKEVPLLTDEEKLIMDKHMKYWHEISQKKFSLFESFNHDYPIKNSHPGGRVLEIGAGSGGHIMHENLESMEFYALEIRPNMAEEIKKKFPKVKVIIGDCQKPMDFPDNYFDRVLAIHLLEHLPDLPSTLKEVCRILKPEGEFCVVIPCEGGLAYTLARRVTSKRVFEKKWGVNYDKFIKAEHINNAWEILKEVDKYFGVCDKTFYPLKIPIVGLNICVGMILKPKKQNKLK